MTDTEIRIAMAELEGWTNLRAVASLNDVRGLPPTDYINSYIGESGEAWVPDYLSDLNAVHRVAMSRSENERNQILGELFYITQRKDGIEPVDQVFATARQRCVAILRTVGKWKERAT